MRFSFMRHARAPIAAGALAMALAAPLAGCPEQQNAPAPPPATEHGRPPSSNVIQDSPKAPEVQPDGGAAAGGTDAGAAATTGAAPDSGTVGTPGASAGADAGNAPGALEKALSNFAGFDKTEARFAFSTYSEGAGAYILQIVVGQQGSPSQRFVLDSEASAQKAKAALDAAGFTTASGALPAGISVDVSVEDGRMKAMVHTADGKNLPAYDGNPFMLGGGGAKVAKAALDRVSPSGNVAAIRVDSISMGEFGGATTYVLVRVGTPK